MKTLLALLAFGLPAAAQSPGEAFALIRIVQHDYGLSSESAAVRAYRTTRPAADVLGLRSITGPSQSWLIESHGSFASVEAMDRALAGVIRAREEAGPPSVALLGLYRPHLSYRPDEAIKLIPTARYFQVSVFRIRPGTEFDFAEVVRLRRLSRDSINLDRPEMGYQIISGTHSGTFVFLAPLQTLRTFDDGWARVPVYAEQAGARSGKQIAAEAEISRELLLFRVEPAISTVTDEFASANADFWRPQR